MEVLDGTSRTTEHAALIGRRKRPDDIDSARIYVFHINNTAMAKQGDKNLGIGAGGSEKLQVEVEIRVRAGRNKPNVTRRSLSTRGTSVSYL